MPFFGRTVNKNKKQPREMLFTNNLYGFRFFFFMSALKNWKGKTTTHSQPPSDRNYLFTSPTFFLLIPHISSFTMEIQFLMKFFFHDVCRTMELWPKEVKKEKLLKTTKEKKANKKMRMGFCVSFEMKRKKRSQRMRHFGTSSKSFLCCHSIKVKF